MTAAAAGDARPVAVSGYMLRIGLPIANVDGTLIVTGTGSGYVSTDDGTAGAIVPTFGAANSGNWVLDLTAAQMTGKKISGYITSNATGAIPTPFVIYPKSRVAIHTGTARTTGSPTTSQIQLATTASDKDSAYNNCLVGITGGTGPGALRRITSYAGATRMATLDAAWGTAPSTDSTYEILPTMEAVDVVAWKGIDIVQDAIPNVAANAAGGLAVLASVSGVLVAPANALKWDSLALPTAFAANNLPSDYAKTGEAATAATAIANYGDLHWTTAVGFALQTTLLSVQSSVAELTNAGTGARTVTTTVTSSGSPLQGARVRYTKGAESYLQVTNASGQTTHYLDDGTWTLVVTMPLYTYAGGTLVVDGNETKSVSMTALSITPPTVATDCRVAWLCLDDSDAASAGVVIRAVPDTDATSTGVAWSGRVREATSGVDGMATLDLPQGSTWTVWRDSGEAVSYTVPATSTAYGGSLRGGRRDAI